MYENTNTRLRAGLQQESPDSGHREMSSDSLTFNLSDNNGNNNIGSVRNSFRNTSVSSPQNSAGVNANNSWYAPVTNRATYNINGPLHPKALTTSGINVHGQEFSLQMRTNHSANRLQKSPNNNTTVSPGNPFSPKKEARSPSAEAQIITPVPEMDASGNRLDLNVAPKIDPPPKVLKRNPSRGGSIGQGDLLVSPDSSRTMSSQSSTTSDNSLNDKRSSRDSSKTGEDPNANLASLASPTLSSKGDIGSTPMAVSPNHNTNPFQQQHHHNLIPENKKLNTSVSSKETLHIRKMTPSAVNENEQNMNNLSEVSTANPIGSQTGSYISAADSTTKLRLSFSDEENTENSEDSGVPAHANGLDTMTFEEFAALSS